MNVLKPIINSKFIKNQSHKIGNDIGGYAAKFAIASVCAKDALGCYYYVTQSLKNEEIPPEKRKFVASLDLVNGVLMLITQLALGLTISKNSFQEKLQKKILGDFYIEDGKKNPKIDELYSKLKRNKALKDLSPDDFAKAAKGVSGTCKAGIGIVSSLVAATIIAKRMIVPFLATPLASWFKNNYMDKKDDKNKEVNNSPTENKSPLNIYASKHHNFFIESQNRIRNLNKYAS